MARTASGGGALDVVLIVTGGLLYAAAVPPHDRSAAAWVALVPLLTVAGKVSARGAFLAGFLYGVVLFAATVAWVVQAVSSYFASGTLGAVAFSAAICVLYVAVYVGLVAVAARRLLATGRWAALVGIPALWVGYELARATVLTGLPWELLGHSQWRHLALIQVADLTGVYGVSFVVAMVNVGLALACRELGVGRHGRGWARAFGPLAVALGVVAATILYGTYRIERESAATPAAAYRVTLVQGNQPVDRAWDRGAAERSVLAYTALTRGALARESPDLVVWPEYAVPLYLAADPMLLPGLRALANATPAGLVFGAPRTGHAAGRSQYFNSAYHLAADGRLQTYDKIRLVPVAESRPVAFGEALAAADDREFSAGTTPTVFTTAAGRLGMLICYEVIFPDMARALVRAGAEILVNISNDGWLDRAGLGASAQHLSIAVFRSVETRRYLARASSTGISGIIDPLGRPLVRLDAHVRGITTGEVRPRHDITPYVRCGDLFALACVLVGIGALLQVAEKGASAALLGRLLVRRSSRYASARASSRLASAPF